MINIGVYNEQKECTYKGETYSVRDNGAVCRHSREGKQLRRLDGVWTFGTPDERGYLFISGVQVHRIVATAFYGEAPSPDYVVDHIDTNRMNNRPENLRWVTRLENILLNPATVKKIELVTGHSIEEVLNDISILRNLKLPNNVSWMTQVTEMEVKQALHSMQEWAKKETSNENFERVERLSYQKSLTKHAARVNQWRVNGYFPSVENCSEVTLKDYLSVLKKGSIIFISDTNDPYTIIADKTEISPDGKALMIICETEGAKPYALMTVKVQDNFFVHSYKMFFKHDGAEKYYELALGRDWTGGDVFDDFC